MKHFIFCLLFAGTLQAQPMYTCPTYPCSSYTPTNGNTTMYQGNHCLTGNILVTDTIGNYDTLSFSNMNCQAIVGMVQPHKQQLNISGSVIIHSLAVDNNDTINATAATYFEIGDILTVGPTGHSVILIKPYTWVLIKGIRRFMTNTYENISNPGNQVELVPCGPGILSLPEKKKPVFSPVLMYNFTVTPFYGGSQMKYRNYTFRRLINELPNGLVLIEAGGLRQVWNTVEKY